jgi:AmiR/NasT family two-component response regulator
MTDAIPNFRGQTALLLHRQDHNRDALEAQLRRIGLNIVCVTPHGRQPLPPANIVFFDADLGYEGLFPWDRSSPPVPLIAVLSSEAPGRLDWALDQGATCYIMKPIGSVGALNALTVAGRLFAERRQLRTGMQELSERIRARPLVMRATLLVMQRLRLDDDRATTLLRQAAMRERTTIEALSARIAASGSLAGLLPEAEPTSTRRSIQRKQGESR